MAKPSAQTAVRLEQELLDRIDALAENLSTEWNRVSRSDAMRAAILRGLPDLEAEAERVKAARLAVGKKPR
jgi:predicted DNA-binding protein